MTTNTARYGLPVAEDGDTGDMPNYSAALTAAVERALDGKQVAAGAGRPYLQAAPNQSGNPVTVWGSTTDNVQLQWETATSAPFAHLRCHIASGTAGHTYFDLMRNDGHAPGLVGQPAASLAYPVVKVGNDLVVGSNPAASTRVVKKDIADADPDTLDWADLPAPVTYRYRHDGEHVTDAERERLRLGWIAEDVPALVQVVDVEGAPADVDVRALCAYLFAEIDRLRARVADLEGNS